MHKQRGGRARIQDINLALLSKLGWMMAKEDNRLWVDILRKKYMHGNSFFACKWKKGDSKVWKRIITTQEIVKKGSCFKNH